MSYFYTFGSKCYVLKNNLNMGKFDERSEECLFVGYSLNSRAYRVFNLKSRIIEETINVKFIENIENDDFDDDVSEEIAKQENISSHVKDEQTSERPETIAPQNIKETNAKGNSEAPSEGISKGSRNLRFISAHPSEEILGDLNTGARTRSIL